LKKKASPSSSREGEGNKNSFPSTSPEGDGDALFERESLTFLFERR
jgi:hypothetical protein